MTNVIARICLACALAAAAPAAAAQQTTGSIAGRVVDQQDAGIEGATITAVNIETGFRREITTGASGLYRVAALPVGQYRVTAVRAGLSSFERDGIIVNVARTTDLEIVLPLAALAETVTVRAEAPIVPITSSTVGQVVEAARIEQLPLNGR